MTRLHHHIMKTILPCLALLAGSSALGLAQSYSIDWFTIAGGGGTSTGGVYSVSAPSASRTPAGR